MKGFFLFTSLAQGQSPCDNIKLYDQMIVKGDQPIFPKLKRHDKKWIPDSILSKMKSEIIKLTSPEFFTGLKIRSVRLFDSAVAAAWSWTNEPIVDNDYNPIYFFYAVLFETRATNGTPFVFRLDVLKNGELLNEKQLAFSSSGKLNIVGCKNCWRWFWQTAFSRLRQLITWLLLTVHLSKPWCGQ